MDNNKITVNGEVYVKESEYKDSDHIIVISECGWIFEGKATSRSKDEGIYLCDAYVVRKWSNGRGIGGLCYPEYVSEYIRDKIMNVHIPATAIVAVIPITEWQS